MAALRSSSLQSYFRLIAKSDQRDPSAEDHSTNLDTSFRDMFPLPKDSQPPLSASKILAFFSPVIKDSFATFDESHRGKLELKFARELERLFREKDYPLQEHPHRVVARQAQEFVRRHTLPWREHESARLVERFGGPIHQQISQRISDTHLVEDLAQEVLEKVRLAGPKFDPTKAQAITFVILLTRNHVTDYLRKAGRRKAVYDTRYPLHENMPSTEPVSSFDREQLAKVLEVLRGLPKLQQQVVENTYLRGRTLRQVAGDLSVPLGTVKSALSRALSELRRHPSLSMYFFDK